MAYRRIVLLSDTHGFLDEAMLRHMQNCDEIWHAGDIGRVQILNQLESMATVRAVYGNIDGTDIRLRCPEHLRFEVAGLKVWMTHIGGRPPRYAQGILPILRRERPDVFICGHSHILLVHRVPSWGGLHVNPGAAGVSGFHHVRTMLTMDLADGEVQNLRVIEWPRAQTTKISNA
ncbi:MAG: hypothetical protein RLZZ314_758 [Bacteroidota bacterium]